MKNRKVACDRCGLKFEILDVFKLSQEEKDEAIAYSVLYGDMKERKGSELLSDYNLCDDCKKEYGKKLVPKFKKDIKKFIKKGK